MALANILVDTTDSFLFLLVKVLNATDMIKEAGERLEKSQANLVTIRGKRHTHTAIHVRLTYELRYDTALKDIDDAVTRTKRQDLPLFLMGHSMVCASYEKKKVETYSVY